MSLNHSFHQSDLPIQLQILNISVNMARMGDLVLKFGNLKADLIKKFLNQTESYLSDLESGVISEPFQPTLTKFISEFNKLKNEQISKNPNLWAERALTWADILQIRSKLA